MKKWMLSLSLFVALLSLSGFSPAAHAVSLAPRTSVQANVYQYASWQEPLASFFDSNYNAMFAVDGSLTLLAQDYSVPPIIATQSMYVHLKDGGYYGIYPGTYDTINAHNGRFMGSYPITGGSCLAPGYPDASSCGDNSSTITPSNWNTDCPITVHHQWYAVDGGTVVGANNWSHPTGAC